MTFLLDTHCWLWLQVSPDEFAEDVRTELGDPRTVSWLSAASSWEIAIKYSIGKLPLPQPPEQYVPARLSGTPVRSLPVQHAHALRVAALPLHHRDPFDRLLIAQAQVDRLTVLTDDRAFALYDVPVRWARAGSGRQ